MKSQDGLRFDPDRFGGTRLGGRWRFILLIVVFNILLIAMVLLSLQQGELRREVIILERTRTVLQERYLTVVVTATRIITVVVTPIVP